MSNLFFETEAELDTASSGLNGAAAKRRHRRRALARQVQLRDEKGWGPLTLECVDISPSGVFLASDFLFEPGEGFILEFISPVTQRTVRVWSRVVRVAEGHRESSTQSSGMAFEFIDLNDDQRKEIASFSAAAPMH